MRSITLGEHQRTTEGSRALKTLAVSLNLDTLRGTKDVLRRTLRFAALVILTQSIISEIQGQTLMLPDPGTQAAPAQMTSFPSLVAQGRRHPSYQVFAGQLALPAIIVVDKTTLKIDGMVEIDVSRLEQLT